MTGDGLALPRRDSVARANGIEIAYETIGDPHDPPLLLVMGLGMQLIHWQLELCERFAQRGFHVIRFDNRDVGLSTKTAAPAPNLRRAFGGPVKASYLLDDMADDAFGLLDRLELRARRGRLDGRDDRPDDGDQPAATGAVGLGHVDHRRAAARAAEGASWGC